MQEQICSRRACGIVSVLQWSGLAQDPKPDGAMNGSRADRLLEKARDGEAESLGQLLQLYRNYLTILANTQLDARLRRRLNPSDVVQEMMLAAHRDFAKFRGTTEAELLGWLRQILINCMHRAVEIHVKTQARDVRREISLQQVSQAMDRSAAAFAETLADPGPSPSGILQRREGIADFADRLAKLRPQYRDVVVLRNLQGLSFDEIAQRLESKPGTVRIWWLRAMEKLKQDYQTAR
jgi:RNA polymerase sigma-70 factor (ECF subfamily)